MKDSVLAPVIDLTGKTALVTGAGRGVGFGIASVLAAAGARIAVNDINPELAELAVGELGGDAFAVPGDVSNEQSVQHFVGKVIDTSGLDILINNAGVAQAHAPIQNQELNDWQHVMDVNLRSGFLLSRAVVSHMSEQRSGAIINIASVNGLNGFSGAHGYGVSKAGVLMLTKTLACEMAQYGVRVNAVAPGLVHTPILEKISSDPKYLETAVSRIPLGRISQPQEIGNAVVFLASDLASYITGVTLPVDGGWTAFGGAGPASKPSSD